MDLSVRVQRGIQFDEVGSRSQTPAGHKCPNCWRKHADMPAARQVAGHLPNGTVEVSLYDLMAEQTRPIRTVDQSKFKLSQLT
ncbi:hypothetical protein TWF718_005302 [Orbilia javanica]|uniref:Uncharacterized protein n=1 Tax=Orbilia javanica TaxID=47235 RepID=A0AAN8N7E4_9PEZI